MPPMETRYRKNKRAALSRHSTQGENIYFNREHLLPPSPRPYYGTPPSKALIALSPDHRAGCRRLPLSSTSNISPPIASSAAPSSPRASHRPTGNRPSVPRHLSSRNSRLYECCGHDAPASVVVGRETKLRVRLIHEDDCGVSVPASGRPPRRVAAGRGSPPSIGTRRDGQF